MLREPLYRMFAKTLGYSRSGRVVHRQEDRNTGAPAAVGYLGKFGRLRKLRSILRRRLCPVRRAKDAPRPTLTIY